MIPRWDALAVAKIVTRYETYGDPAIRAFEYSVLDFVAKPFTPKRLSAAALLNDSAIGLSVRHLKGVGVSSIQQRLSLNYQCWC